MSVALLCVSWEVKEEKRKQEKANQVTQMMLQSRESVQLGVKERARNGTGKERKKNEKERPIE